MRDYARAVGAEGAHRLIGRGDPVLDRYARVTFEKALIVGQPQAELLAPGHPLLESVVDVALERFEPLLGQGAVLVDEADDGTDPRLLTLRLDIIVPYRI